MKMIRGAVCEGCYRARKSIEHQGQNTLPRVFLKHTRGYTFVLTKTQSMKKLLFTLATAGIFFASCDKKTTTPNNNNTTNNTNTTPSPVPGSGDGAIVSIKSVTKTTVSGFPITTELGTAVAVFGNLSGGSYTDAGTITVNSKTLAKQANNSYVYTPSATDITGIDLSGAINWNVGGAGSNPAFTHDASAQGFPAASDISGSFTTINSASDFTLSTSGSVTGSDSVYFQLSGPSATVLKRMAGNTSSVTFTAAEVQSVGKGSGVVTIAPWNWTVQTKAGKQINVVNELALTRVVTIE